MVLGEQGKWLGVLGPEMRIVEMSCESGGWAKVARLESGVRGTVMSCQLGRETRGTVLEAASEVGLALSSAASVWSSVGAARELGDVARERTRDTGERGDAAVRGRRSSAERW